MTYWYWSISISLIGPQICRLFLEIGKLDLAETSLIRSIPVICPRITHLSMCVYYKYQPEESDHFSEMIWETVCCYELSISGQSACQPTGTTASCRVCQLAEIGTGLLVQRWLHVAVPTSMRVPALEISTSGKTTIFLLPFWAECAFPGCRAKPTSPEGLSELRTVKTGDSLFITHHLISIIRHFEVSSATSENL